MGISCTGIARIQHKETGEFFEIPCEELDWDEEGMGEGPMGIESQHKAVVDHPDLGILVWTLREYPAGTEDNRETNTGKHLLIKDFDYSIHHKNDAEW